MERSQIQRYRLTLSTSIEEVASKASGLAGRPAAIIRAPREATIAPLSVQRAGSGMAIVILARSQRSVARWRRRELAATPPAITRRSIPDSWQARTAFCRRTSTTASWNEAATSAFAYCGVASRYLATAVLSPENEKS